MPNRYKYEGKPLTPKIAESLILTLFTGTSSIRRKYIEDGTTEFHKSQGGLENPSMHMWTIMNNLKNKGFAEPLGG